MDKTPTKMIDIETKDTESKLDERELFIGSRVTGDGVPYFLVLSGSY